MTDIVFHRLSVYSAKADDLVVKIVKLGGRARLEPMLAQQFNPYGTPDVPKLERVLEEIHRELYASARESGWELDY